MVGWPKWQPNPAAHSPPSPMGWGESRRKARDLWIEIMAAKREGKHCGYKQSKKEEFAHYSSANRCPGTSWQAGPQHAGLLLENTNAKTINVPPLSSFPWVFIAEHMMTYGTEYPFDHLDSAVPALLHSNLLPTHACYTLRLEVQIKIFKRQNLF